MAERITHPNQASHEKAITVLIEACVDPETDRVNRELITQTIDPHSKVRTMNYDASFARVIRNCPICLDEVLSENFLNHFD